MTDTSPPARPILDPVDTSFDPTDVTARDDVESPSLSSGNALARFEFEPGRSKDGTKVLMVEWEDDANTRNIKGDWEISWEGKKTVLPARENGSSSDNGEQPVNRLYFLLGPGVSVPSTVRLQKGSVLWRTNPLPAIFAPELGATAREAGKKGVLHTIWAKKRLQVLQREIDAEVEKNNIEGIGLEMAAAEKEWIEQNFGVNARPSTAVNTAQPAMASVNFGGSPSSPRSPGGGRLMDKLKGLKIGTSASDLNANSNSQPAGGQHNPLSPETSDVAIGGFSSFAQLKGVQDPSTLAAKPAQRPVVAQRTPAAAGGVGAMGSLNAFAASGDAGAPGAKEDDLFALPMSPRSPEMKTSPFSLQDVGQQVR